MQNQPTLNTRFDLHLRRTDGQSVPSAVVLLIVSELTMLCRAHAEAIRLSAIAILSLGSSVGAQDVPNDSIADVRTVVNEKMHLRIEKFIHDDALGRIYLPFDDISAATVWLKSAGSRDKRLEVEVKNGLPTHVAHYTEFGEAGDHEFSEYTNGRLTNYRIRPSVVYRDQEYLTTEFDYDDQGRVVYVFENRNGGEMFSGQCEYARDQVRITTFEVRKNGGVRRTLSRWKLECDGDHVLAESLSVDAEPERCTRRWSFDDRGHVQSEESYGANRLDSLRLFERDTVGDSWEKELRGSGNGTLLVTRIAQFDAQHRVVRSSYWDCTSTVTLEGHAKTKPRSCMVHEYLDGTWLAGTTRTPGEVALQDENRFIFDRDSRGSIVGRRRLIYDHNTASVREDDERMEIELHYLK